MNTCLVDLSKQRPFRLPVVITNQSEHDIVIPAKCQIADISAYQCILSKEQSVVNLQKADLTQEANCNFNFGESPIPPEWKGRITRLLNNMPDVFAQHDLDFGRTDKVLTTSSSQTRLLSNTVLVRYTLKTLKLSVGTFKSFLIQV